MAYCNEWDIENINTGLIFIIYLVPESFFTLKTQFIMKLFKRKSKFVWHLVAGK